LERIPAEHHTSIQKGLILLQQALSELTLEAAGEGVSKWTLE